MNDELIKREALIKRIDAYIDCDDVRERESETQLLEDCRAEIERLTEELKESRALGLKLAQDRETQDAENESLRDQNTALDEKLAEYSERKYVPMTNDELERIWNDHKFGFGISNVSHANRFNLLKALEAEVIRRAGLEVEK